MLGFLWITAVVLIVDQISKYVAVDRLVLGQPVELLPFLNLTLTYNPGAAFGFLSSASGWQKTFFIGIATVASILIVSWLRRLSSQERLLAVALSLILGGAVGNVIDRMIYGKVVDFIDFHLAGWHFWTFNVADSAITIGAVLLIVDSLFPLLSRRTSR